VAVQLRAGSRVGLNVHAGARSLLSSAAYSRTSRRAAGPRPLVGGFNTWGENRTVRRQSMMSAAGVPAFRLARRRTSRGAAGMTHAGLAGPTVSRPAWATW